MSGTTFSCARAVRKLVESGQPIVAFEDEGWRRLLPLSNRRPDGDNMGSRADIGFDGGSANLPREQESRSYDAVDWAELADAPDQTERGSLSAPRLRLIRDIELVVILSSRSASLLRYIVSDEAI
jgi:hypothetical protein